MGQSFTLEDSSVDAPRNRSERHQALADLKIEVAGYRAELARLEELDPEEIMIVLSGVAGRLAEIRALLYDMQMQPADQFRTRQVDPLREDLEFHFKVHSRRVAIMEWELKTSGGAP